MARLRMRLIRFGDRDGLGTSEATRTRGRLPSVAAGSRTDTTWQVGEIVGIRNWVLGGGIRDRFAQVLQQRTAGLGTAAVVGQFQGGFLIAWLRRWQRKLFAKTSRTSV